MECYHQVSQDEKKEKSMSSKTIKKKGLHRLLRELSDDENDSSAPHASAPVDPDRPWYPVFCQYIDAVEQVPDGWSIVKWWGVSCFFTSI